MQATAGRNGASVEGRAASAAPDPERWADNMKAGVPFAIILLLSCTGVATGDAKVCSRSEAIAAEKGLAHLHSWADLQQAFRTFAHCDDGAIAEGYSDFCMRMLSRHWSDVAALAKLAESDPSFRSFVLRHIDETWLKSEFDLAVQNATSRCPNSARALCTDILTRTTELGERDAPAK